MHWLNMSFRHIAAIAINSILRSNHKTMVKTGLDVLVHEQAYLLANQRVGLVSMPAAVLPDLTSSLDALLGVAMNVTALFGPEHGFGGVALDGAKVDDVRDPRTGLP